MHHPEYHKASSGQRLNWIRASVLGANDGIVSIAGLLFGIAGATTSHAVIFATGIAGIVAGALSMAVGEFVSVSSSRDAERALLNKEKYELDAYPEQELSELIGIYEKKGLSKGTATTVAKELTAHDAFKAHAEAELKIDPEHLTNPWAAGSASALSYTLGGIVPLVAILLPPASVHMTVAFIAILLALVLTGYLSAQAGGAGKIKAILRNVLGGILAMAITYGIGTLVGTGAL